MSAQRMVQPRRHRDTEILCVFVSLWLILSVLSVSSVSITRMNSWARRQRVHVSSIQAMATWLHGTKLSWAVAGGVPWLWPLCETLHFMGLALLVGLVGVF